MTIPTIHSAQERRTAAMKLDYAAFLHTKGKVKSSDSIDISTSAIYPKLFPFQRDIVRWALRKGRAAIFADTGLGKTFMQLEWSRLSGYKTLIIAPLSVAKQTIREAQKIDIEVKYARSQADVGTSQLSVTNYEMVDKFDLSAFGAVVLDEASILKSFDSKTRRKLTDMCADVPYRLCCTATPAPNDSTELGNHAEFLGICSQAEMLATFFINANKQKVHVINDMVYETKGSNRGGQEWRLKHHAEVPFFRWLSSWAISLMTPSDLGYSDEGFILPPLNINPIFVQSDYVPTGQMFFTGLRGIADRVHVRRQTITPRLDRLRSLIGDSPDQWVIWCGLDKEQEAIAEMLGDRCISVYGSLMAEEKEARIERWLDGQAQILLSKPRICGFGLNLQQASKMVFFGINDSWETFYQCIRREWRYGQMSPVNVHVVLSDAEAEVYYNVLRKDALAKRLRQGLIAAMWEFEKGELDLTEKKAEEYQEDWASGKSWNLYLGDSCERLKEIEPESIDLSIYSPPFADLYVYSQSERDLGNSRGWDEFFEHYAYIIKEILRVTKPGRLTCVHSSDIPAMLSRDGWIGLKDFPGEIIRAYERQGWIFVGRAFVQKNPQAQAVRTKSKALLFVQLRKDSADSRPALIDQILLFRKPGDNAVPVSPVANGELDNDTWIEWAHGIWLGIQESDTLSYARARDAEDEKHICPLQLGTIERCIKLYSNPGELILSPFAGIGSEGYEAVRLGRRFVGIELKPSYYRAAIENLRRAEHLSVRQDMFSLAEERA